MTDDLDWETLDTGVDYSCPGFDVRRDDVRLPDGTETEFHFLTEPAAVVVLPFTTAGDVVVIDEWRQAVKRVNHGLPAGTVEPGDDDLTAAARRELAEETGYEADEVEHLLTAEPMNGAADSVYHYFVARGCERTATQSLDENESIVVDTEPFAALREAALTGRLRDGRSMLGVLYYACNRS